MKSNAIAAFVFIVLLTTCFFPHSTIVAAGLTQTVKIGTNPPIPNGGVVPPKLLQYSPPSYTPEALVRVVEGKVTVEAAVDAFGNLSVLRVVSGLGFGLDDQAIAALKTWRFAPATREGERVPVIAQIDVDFKLPDVARTKLRLKQQLEELHRELQQRMEYQQKEKATLGTK